MEKTQRLRPVQKRGNGYFLPLWAADMKDFELEEGQEVNIADIVPIKSKPRSKKK